MTMSQSRWGGNSTVGSRWSREDDGSTPGLRYGGMAAAAGGAGAYGYGSYLRRSGNAGIARQQSAIAMRDTLQGEFDDAQRVVGQRYAAYRSSKKAKNPRKSVEDRLKELDEAAANRNRYRGAPKRGAYVANNFAGGGLIDAQDAIVDTEGARMPRHMKSISRGNMLRRVGPGVGLAGLGAYTASATLRRRNARPMDKDDPDLADRARRRDF